MQWAICSPPASPVTPSSIAQREVSAVLNCLSAPYGAWGMLQLLRDHTQVSQPSSDSAPQQGSTSCHKEELPASTYQHARTTIQVGCAQGGPHSLCSTRGLSKNTLRRVTPFKHPGTARPPGSFMWCRHAVSESGAGPWPPAQCLTCKSAQR